MTANHGHPGEGPSGPVSPGTPFHPKRELARGAGKGRVLFFDAVGGVAGDMLVASLLDLGVPLAHIQHALAGLRLTGFEVTAERVFRSGVAAARFLVHEQTAQPSRDYAQIRVLLEQSTLATDTRAIASAAFERLAAAEAEVHGVAIDDVHFHEVGAVDSIVDIVAAAAGLEYLGAHVVVSHLPMGRGLVATSHGPLPVPAPATLLCLRGVPTYDTGLDAELVTPTGACLVTAVAHSFERWPAMRPDLVGVGAGARLLPDRPNILRAVLGDAVAGAGAGAGRDAPVHLGEPSHALVACNLDDCTPEVIAHAVDRMLAAGALDAWTTPIGMKKGRAATELSALVTSSGLDAVARVMLAETTTLGVRIANVRRVERPRQVRSVDTPFGPVRVKEADGDGLPPLVSPEFDDCRAQALAHDVPIRDVYAAALRAAAADRTR